MEAVLILILTATTIAAAGSGKTAVNAVVETATAGATMTAAAVAIITAEIAAMNARTTMTAAAEMISVRSHALNPGPLTSIKAMCAAVKNIKTIVMTDNKNQMPICFTNRLTEGKCAGYTRTFFILS